jgi:hypothetical protein
MALGLGASLLGLVGLTFAPGCGGSVGEPVSPSDSVGTAVQEVDAAEARIGAALGGGRTNPPTSDVSPQVVKPELPTPTTNPGPGPQPTPNETPLDTQEDQCRVACDALTSMLRAVDRLCTITGQTDERCQSRRARADNASSRVVQACPSCNV